ncbi:MAG TPA: ABC transporter permease [Acidimicrobiales bacterium]|nr:ABC transporter permease [Acidimicrobiales bacterium]
MTGFLFVGIQGLIIGLTYGLLAVGLVLIYKSNRVVNFAHGELGVISAALLEKLVNDNNLPYWPTLGFVLLLAMLIGGATELALRRLFKRPRLIVMVATIGVSQLLFVLSLWSLIQPSEGARAYPVPFGLTATIDTFILVPAHFVVLIFAPVVAGAIAVFFSLTPYGLAVRAAAENAESARLGGIWVRRMSTLSWMLAGVLSAATAIMGAPFLPNVFAPALGPTLLVRALAAALIGGMVNLRVAFVAGIAVGIIEQAVLYQPRYASARELVMFAILLLALLVRGRSLRTTSRTEERSSWQQAGAARLQSLAPDRARLGQFGTALTLVALIVMPALLSNSKAYLFSRIFIFAVVSVSLTLLSGWAGQLSLGHFGLAALGALVAARLGDDLALPVLLVVAGLLSALAAVIVGLPALRIRGLYLAVTTLGFAVLVHEWVLTHDRVGLPDPAATLLRRPTFLGIDLAPQRSFYYFALLLLVVVLVLAGNLRRSGVGRAMIAVRENEVAAAAAGVRVMRVKLTAFAISGFFAGLAGVVFAFNEEQLAARGSISVGSGQFGPLQSIFIVAMVVIGGMGSIRGAVLGAVYLLGIPAVFGYSQVAELLTGGIGLTVFVLYLPGGLVSLVDSVGDGVTSMWMRRSTAAATAPAEVLVP